MREAMTITDIRAPLHTQADGVVRVAGTRVTLDTVVEAFLEGATPEEIQQQYPSLQLPQVYLVVAYYLVNRAAVDAYLQQRAHLRAQVRQQDEARSSLVGVRERLLNRKAGDNPSRKIP